MGAKSTDSGMITVPLNGRVGGGVSPTKKLDSTGQLEKSCWLLPQCEKFCWLSTKTRTGMDRGRNEEIINGLGGAWG